MLQICILRDCILSNNKIKYGIWKYLSQMGERLRLKNFGGLEGFCSPPVPPPAHPLYMQQLPQSRHTETGTWGGICTWASCCFSLQRPKPLALGLFFFSEFMQVAPFLRPATVCGYLCNHNCIWLFFPPSICGTKAFCLVCSALANVSVLSW